MESSSGKFRIGDRSTSDIVVRIRTQDGRDNWIYCHAIILTTKSKYFADRLSDKWPTCQILDSRSCVEVHCEECDFDHHVSALRLLYIRPDETLTNVMLTEFSCVKNALGILRAAVALDCPEIVATCVKYLEATPWEEPEEEEILKIVPGMGPRAEPVLARLQPVNHSFVVNVFVSAVRFATSSPPSSVNDLKISAQEQLEYMLTEDDDAPLLTCDNATIKAESNRCIDLLLARFTNLVDSFEAEKTESFLTYLCDLLWASQIGTKLDISSNLVLTWVETSERVLKMESLRLEIQSKVVEVVGKVMECIGFGTVILPALARGKMVKLWLPFVREVRVSIDSVDSDEENNPTLKSNKEVWQSLEASFVSTILTLPSSEQAEILTEWLGDKRIGYPDLTEAFEVWCYRSKLAKRRFALIDGNDQMVG